MIHLNSNQFIILDDLKKENISFDITKSMDLFLIKMNELNKSFNFVFKVNTNTTLNVYFFSAISDAKDSYKIEIDHKPYSTVNLEAKLFVNKTSSINFNVDAKINRASKGCNTSQKIDGFIFSNDAKISVIPALLVDINKINAYHAVNISHFNKDSLFYLQTKGLNINQSTKILLEKELFVLKKTQSNQIYNNIYEKLLTKISKMYK